MGLHYRRHRCHWIDRIDHRTRSRIDKRKVCTNLDHGLVNIVFTYCQSKIVPLTPSTPSLERGSQRRRPLQGRPDLLQSRPRSMRLHKLGHRHGLRHITYPFRRRINQFKSQRKPTVRAEVEAASEWGKRGCEDCGSLCRMRGD